MTDQENKCDCQFLIPVELKRFAYKAEDVRINCALYSLSSKLKVNTSDQSYREILSFIQTADYHKGTLHLGFDKHQVKDRIEFIQHIFSDSVPIHKEDTWMIEYDLFDDTLPDIEEPPSRIISKEVRYQICKEQKWKCNECFCTLKFTINSVWEGEVAHIDHIHPYADYATYINGMDRINERKNLQALCGKCNNQKRRKKA